MEEHVSYEKKEQKFFLDNKMLWKGVFQLLILSLKYKIHGLSVYYFNYHN